jgi:16S rRNA processing protein RimM
MARTRSHNPDRKVCIGAIAGVHGVRGLVRIKSFTDAPEDVAAYGPVTDASGSRRFVIEAKGMVRGMVLAHIDGVDDRDVADRLRGTELYVDRDVLPVPGTDEFYHTDLIGLDVEMRDGAHLGRVKAVQNYGAGDILEVARDDGGIDMLPFTHAVVPEVDLTGRRLVVKPPYEVTVRSDENEAGAEPGEVQP